MAIVTDLIIPVWIGSSNNEVEDIVFKIEWDYWGGEPETRSTPASPPEAEINNIYLASTNEPWSEEKIDLLYALGEGEGEGLHWDDITSDAINTIKEQIDEAKADAYLDAMDMWNSRFL